MTAADVGRGRASYDDIQRKIKEKERMEMEKKEKEQARAARPKVKKYVDEGDIMNSIADSAEDDEGTITTVDDGERTLSDDDGDDATLDDGTATLVGDDDDESTIGEALDRSLGIGDDEGTGAAGEASTLERSSSLSRVNDDDESSEYDSDEYESTSDSDSDDETDESSKRASAVPTVVKQKKKSLMVGSMTKKLTPEEQKLQDALKAIEDQKQERAKRALRERHLARVVHSKEYNEDILLRDFREQQKKEQEAQRRRNKQKQKERKVSSTRVGMTVNAGPGGNDDNNNSSSKWWVGS